MLFDVDPESLLELELELEVWLAFLRQASDLEVLQNSLTTAAIA